MMRGTHVAKSVGEFLRKLPFLLSCFVFSIAGAQSAVDYAVQVSAVVQKNPPQITLKWPGDSQATSYVVARKARDAASWGTTTTLPGSATSYVDTNVVVGGDYEYQVGKIGWVGQTSYLAGGYVYAGIEVPLVESRGKVILLIDGTVAPILERELNRLQLDLIGDGWTVLRHDVSRTDSVTNIKAIIKADFLADPANVKTVFLFGHVPVPYSGHISPDGHSDHSGAWPADAYYGEMNSTWTDSSVNATTAGSTRNWNVPGDGKFDQSSLPSSVELQVGRVDLASLSAFPLAEVELLRQYLNKNHNFRHAFLQVARRGLIDDNFGAAGGEAFAACGWRNFAPCFGSTNVHAGDWLTTLDSQKYLWAYGCGSGGYGGAVGVGTTAELVTRDPQVVFTMLFGSYFGDWDSPNNFLRAQLATPGYTLASAWAGRPFWQFHHMALGETVGFSTRVSQNNVTTYVANLAMGWVHIALMGDPTLRLHPVSPPSRLTVITNVSGGVNLNWIASTDDEVRGYHVYRAPTIAGPFSRLNENLIVSTNFSDALISSNIYMVRAVKLEVDASGSYYNPSQGLFQSLDPSIPGLVLLQPTNNAIRYEFANVSLTVSTFDVAASISRVEFFANSQKLGEATAPPFNFLWQNVPVGDHDLTARAVYSGGSTNSTAVTIHVSDVPAPVIAIKRLNEGTFEIRGNGTPFLTYRLQTTEAMGSSWEILGAVTANASGLFALTNSTGLQQRYYRAVYP